MESEWIRVNQPEIVRNIDRFHPVRIRPDAWDAIGPIVKEAVRATEPHSTIRSQELLTVAARVAEWAWDLGRPTIVGYLFHPATIDEYISTYCGELSEGTRSNYRTQLRQIGAANIGPPTYGPRAQPLWKRSPKAPYTDKEVTQIIGSIGGYSTERQRTGLECLIGLSYGTGMERSEIGLACGSDVEARPNGVVVHVRGKSARPAVVREDWAPTVAELAERAGSRPIFLPGRGLTDGSQLKGFIERLPKTSAPKITLAKFRNTWIVDLLRKNVRIDVIARAAGVNADQIGYYSQFLEMVDEDTYVDLLS